MSVENLDEIIPVVDGLANNKAAVFAYTEQAYQDNDVNGVSQYDFSKEQNIPDRNSTDTNGQVLIKGFRSQGSSIARNFFNHFIGRFSYNLNKMVDMFKSFLASYKTDYRKNGFMYNATLQYQVGDVCMDVWTDNTFAFFIRTGNGGSAGVRPMVADGENWTTSEHWACMGSYANTAQSFALRDKTGKIQVADPTDTLDAANKTYVDTKASSEADAVQTNLTNHINNQASGVHGATASATASKLVIRDAAGRAQVTTPSADSDIATKKYVDDTASSEAETVQTNLTSHINTTTGVHGAVATATANKLIIRDSAGRAKVASPAADSDIATKKYVDDTASGDASAVQTNLTSHINNKSNPHAVKLSQLGVTATATELNYVDGVTSNIQTQLNGKAAKSHASTDGTYGVGTTTNYGHVKTIDNPNIVAYPSGTKGVAVTPFGVLTMLQNMQQYWFKISDTKFEENIYGIAYGNGKFVAVGTSGKVVYSTNGVSWTVSVRETSSVHLNAVAYGNRKFVAVGGAGKIIYSTDGVSWTDVFDFPTIPFTLRGICYGNGKFVAVGDSEKGIYSSDGVSWQPISNMNAHGNNLLSVAYGNGKFVAAGESGFGSYSTNGTTWTPANIRITDNICSVTYGNGKFVAVGDSGEVSYSEDGVTWTSTYNISKYTLLAVAYGNGKFVAGGVNTDTSYSEDGINWTDIPTLPIYPYDIHAIAYGNGKFVVVGASGKGAYCYAV